MPLELAQWSISDESPEQTLRQVLEVQASQRNRLRQLKLWFPLAPLQNKPFLAWLKAAELVVVS
jgi:uncharacterized protein YccT (UPF0319 family)